MALATLANTKWLLNNAVDYSYNKWIKVCGVTKNKRTFVGISIYNDGANSQLSYKIPMNVNNLYTTSVNTARSGWVSEDYREITLFEGGYSETQSDYENPEAIAWFEANAVQIPLVTLQEKEAIPSAEVQEITPDAGFIGLSKVTVQRVENENLIPANIKKGVEIFGVTGTFDGFDPSNPIAQMTNLAGSGQDQFVHDWAQMAKIQLHEQGVSNAFLATDEAQFILAKAVTDLIEDGTLSATTLSLIATLRVNHPHTEDEEEATQNV